MNEVTAAYQQIHAGRTVVRTATITDTLLVDLDDDGAVIGVETIGKPVTVAVLAEVLRHCVWRDVRRPWWVRNAPSPRFALAFALLAVAVSVGFVVWLALP